MLRRLVLAACLVSSLVPVAAHAHGGLPVSLQIVFRDGQLVVPTRYWGVFLGKDGGPWRWICEEAINKDQRRVWALAGSGAYHVTDFAGLTSSRDGGCTWTAATGEIAARSTSHVAADPVEPARAWATTDAGDAAYNALYTTTDDGLTWTPVLQADEYLRAVALSSDGQTIYVTGTARTAGTTPSQVLHVSRDRGATWTSRGVDFMVDGALPRMRPLAVDPADASIVYLVAEGDPTRALVRGDAEGAQLTEVLRAKNDIGEMMFDGARKQIMVATGDGMFRAPTGGTFAAAGGLSRAQCVTEKDGHYYSCSWNYEPDNAAIARSDDGGTTWKKVFQYADTVGPIDTCPAETPVARMCPQVWRMYADQLGIDLFPADKGMKPVGPESCSCALGARGRGGVPFAPVAGALLVLGFLGRRRARRRRLLVDPE